MRTDRDRKGETTGSIELIVLGLMAALIVALAIPVFFGGSKKAPQESKQQSHEASLPSPEKE
ncbi:MAG: hypothetical protein DCC75_08965 [Proteobacteria bacterium]|nr:MAG: hypothetical protein DCC75_08965 [Pseudomonadota bacterium]